MAQTLLLGLGGTGSRIVNEVVAELKKNNKKINDGNICCAVLDTNENDNNLIKGTDTGVPVIGTSKKRTIKDYMSMYSYKGVRAWMPTSPRLLKESMIDGASQMRPKSRLALFDTIDDGTIFELEKLIDKLFDYRDDAKIRVMIVSSLAGGTGSGMFIQTALWLRKFFEEEKKCPVTIRGIFVLPDVFIRTLDDMRKDMTERNSLFANAYAAVRELNALTKIKTKGAHTLLPVKIDELFDSEEGQPDGAPIYDYAFFVDDSSEEGSVLKELNQYEKVIARMVYMQLFAPMHSDLYSEEDNLFKRFEMCDEPVFGACGTAKAVYPMADILRYCALNATKDSVSTGWRRLDLEIKDKQRKEEEKEKRGAKILKRLDPRGEYMRLYENKTDVSADSVGKDRLFLNIAHDTENERIEKDESGEINVEYTDKVEDFLGSLEEMIATAVDSTDPAGLSRIKLDDDWAEDTSAKREDLISEVEDIERNVQRFVEKLDEEVEVMTEDIMDNICSVNMGDVNQNSPLSVFSFLTKKDSNQMSYFIHPLAVRYLLYKLTDELETIKKTSAIDEARKNALEAQEGDGAEPTDFDNKRTRAVEDTPLDYLRSKAFGQNEAKFLKKFRSLYAPFNRGQYYLCRAYAIKLLRLHVAIELSQRLESLIDITEGFFKNLVKVSNSLDDAIDLNKRKNAQVARKEVYVCASEAEKAAMYDSLNFDVGKSNKKINEMVVRALYGQFCAKENPTADNNQAFVGKSVETTFFKEAVDSYQEEIYEKYRDEIDLDIFTAICKSSDIVYEKAEEERKKDAVESERLNVDLETGEVVEEDSKYVRHQLAMKAVAKRLAELGAPFLYSDEEQPQDLDEHLLDAVDEGPVEDYLHIPIKKRKTFWGFHPIVAEKCPALGEILGVDVTRQQNSAYRKNELDCYRAVYGIQAKYIEKFDECRDGEYFRHYRHIVKFMEDKVKSGDSSALIHTPHLDKTWHRFLPYVTDKKQREEDNKFYRLFWLAIAYGMISLDKHGRFLITRTKKSPAGVYEVDEQLQYRGKSIKKSDITELLSVLKVDGSFVTEASRLEKVFAEECEKMDTGNYEDTQFLRGRLIKKEFLGEDSWVKEFGEIEVPVEEDCGMMTAQGKIVGGVASKSELNALTVLVKYNCSPKCDSDSLAVMIQSLEELCRNLAANRYASHEHKKVEYVGFELCKRIYQASARKDKDIDAIEHWKAVWSAGYKED